MEKIKACVYVICAVSVSLTLYKMLAPGGKYKKQINFISALVYTAVIISMLGGIRVKADGLKLSSVPELDYSAIEEQYYSELLENTKNRVASLLTDKLTQKGISVAKITVNADITDSDSIIITEAECELYDESQSEQAAGIIKGEVDEGAVITVTGCSSQ
ncbi:MAG: hypothetical protein ACI4JX_03170 [Oscillospiraceae bacterium]